MPPQQIERSVDRCPVKVAACIVDGPNLAAGQAQKDRLRNILRIGHAAGDAEGCEQNAPVMFGEQLREDLLTLDKRCGLAGCGHGFTCLIVPCFSVHGDDVPAGSLLIQLREFTAEILQGFR